MKTERFYKIVIMILVVINISMMVFLWVNRPPKLPHPHEHKIAQMLGLRGVDQKKVNKLEIEHHKEKRKLVHIDMALHDQLFEVLGDKETSDSLLIEIQTNKSLIEQMTYDYFSDISGFCNEEQKEILHDFLSESFAKLRGPGPGPAPMGR